MIELTDAAAASLLRGNQKRFLRVESWYDDMLLHDDVPVSAGSEEIDRASNVPERVTLTVPRVERGFDFTPVGTTDPLAANGQMLKITIGVETTMGVIEWLQRGWYVITTSELSKNGDSVSVEAAGLLWKIQEARLVSPLQPSGTFKSLIRDLVEPALTVDFDPALVDRAVPASVNYDQDRLDALNVTLAAWPATAEVTNEGFLYVTSVADPAVVSLELSSGQGGTVISRTGASTRDGVYNAVVAQGQTDDGQVVRGVAYDLNGPKRSGGPFNELPVPFYFDSPLIRTAAQAQAAANSRLMTMKRSTSQTYDVEMVPHPALQAGDRVLLDGKHGIVERLNLPLTAGGGVEALKVRVI